jgi:ribonuclease HII
MNILGIDEAGRGSIIGPMVVCGAMIEKGSLKELHSLGVKDSKMLDPKKREFLDKKIRRICKVYPRVVTAEEIDMNMGSGTNLNQIEAIQMAKIINKMKPDKVYIDALNGIPKFLLFMGKFLEHKPEMVLEHKADEKYPIVSAASIVAKVRRDKELRKIEKEVGIDLGVGYPHDIKSTNGLKKNMRNKKFMKYVRRSWSTYSRIKEEVEQSKLIDY